MSELSWDIIGYDEPPVEQRETRFSKNQLKKEMRASFFIAKVFL